ncbi:hypothetical protein B0H17DRAFT_1104205 [Mycena rosella]|uniref:Uncharacterized protein n=1 Tax=Mycena rosella TaxID=1033263 RepID=A0AAD7FVN9_MYCRO|nr:hypothetical protein B0H17DRAFT_1104205 [Mycena rosella]
MWALKISTLSAWPPAFAPVSHSHPHAHHRHAPRRAEGFAPAFPHASAAVCASSPHRGNHPPRSSATLISTHTADEDGLWRG